MSRYLLNVLISMTQAGNAIFGGYPDEALSSRAHRQQHKRRWRIARSAINRLFFWQGDHCAGAYLAERQRRQYPPSLRDPS